MNNNESDTNDKIVFAKETEEKIVRTKRKPWKIIIADDDEDIHFLTRMVMEDYSLDEKELEFLSAYSGEETKKLIQENSDTALILLDIVMESEEAGFKVVKYIREVLKNSIVRIILRTGQPGKAPEKKVIIKYDINDYKEKTELTTQKLFTTITASLRSYKDLKIKEILLKQNHYRVNNTLQIISSMLRLQARYIDDKQTKSIFKESQNRIEAMALIHEKLYSSQNLEEIDVADYIYSLVNNLINSYNIDKELVKINIDTDNIYLAVDLGIPCALIINELLSNVFKCVLPENKKGEINIKFKLEKDNYSIVVSDNGIGLSQELNLQNVQSLGLQFVNELVTQINGILNIKKDKGIEYKIIFMK